MDLYDFCYLLLFKCIEFDKLVNDNDPRKKLLINLAIGCLCVLFQVEAMVRPENTYFVGSELQYSHGVSVYFPWTVPEKPAYFDPQGQRIMALTEYKTYRFAGESGWLEFLRTYYRHTIRPVRRKDLDLTRLSQDNLLDVLSEGGPRKNDGPAAGIDLSKSHPESGSEDGPCTCQTIKNYPRRNYLSLADNDLRNTIVSYLGWNPHGLLREVAGLPRDITPTPEEKADTNSGKGGYPDTEAGKEGDAENLVT